MKAVTTYSVEMQIVFPSDCTVYQGSHVTTEGRILTSFSAWSRKSPEDALDKLKFIRDALTKEIDSYEKGKGEGVT